MVMLSPAYRIIVLLLPFLSIHVHHVKAFDNFQFNDLQRRSTQIPSWDSKKSAFLDNLVMNMTIPELGMEHGLFSNLVSLSKAKTHIIVLQMHLMFADNIIGPKSDNALYGN